MFRSTVGKTVLKIGAGTSLLYGAGIVLSLQNDAFNELFTDNVPLAEEVVDFLQSFQSTKRDYNVQNFKEKFSNLDKTLSIPKSGLTPAKIDKVKETVKVEPKAEKKPVSTPPAVKAATKLPLIVVKAQNKDVQQVIDEFNQVIEKINSGNFSDGEHFKNITEFVSTLDSNLVQFTENAKKELESKIQETTQAKENQLLEKFSKELTDNLNSIKQKHEAQLINEISKTKETLEVYYKNQVKLNGIQAQNDFTKLIKKSIEEERDGKYSQFNELNHKLEKLQSLVLTIDDHLNNSELKVQLQLTLNKLRSKLSSDKIQNLSPEISQLSQIAKESDNKVIINAINAIDEQSIKDGLLTQSQLITRFNLLVPELRTSALLPPNAGVLGHLSAKLFSTLLFSKEGQVEGKDIESVIARVQNSLTTNHLDDAVEEIANLKGWSRKLADDWLIESRKRLELEFLVKLIDLESRTLF